jgi:hypothetical protein
MTRDLKTIHAQARKAFAKRDKLEAELRAVNNELNRLKAEHMVATRIWGIRDERFRQEANTTKVAA